MTQTKVNYRKGEELSIRIPLSDITVTHNPRHPCPNLEEQGFSMIDLVHEYALSDDPDNRAYFCKLIEENEPEMVEQAESMQEFGQIQSIVVRSFRAANPQSTPEKKLPCIVRYGIACGERRYIASAYLQAKTGTPCAVKATVKRLSVQEAYDVGVQENLQRKQMKEWEVGAVMEEWAKRNGKSNRKAPVRAVAEHFKTTEPYARGRMALSKLAPERLELLKKGKLTLTNAIKEALGEPGHVSPERTGKRHNACTLKQMEDLFDETPRNQEDRLRAIADCMKRSYEEALAQSDARLDKAEQVEAAAALREAAA